MAQEICCKVCGTTDVTTFKWHGQTRRRNYCKTHWNEYKRQRHTPKRNRTGCEVCGSPDLAIFHERGKTYRRRFCKTHWNEFERRGSRERRKKQNPFPNSWPAPRKLGEPVPEGIDRITISTRNQSVIYATGEWSQSWPFKKLKRLKSRVLFENSMRALGFKIVRQDRWVTTLERPISMRRNFNQKEENENVPESSIVPHRRKEPNKA